MISETDPQKRKNMDHHQGSAKKQNSLIIIRKKRWPFLTG